MDAAAFKATVKQELLCRSCIPLPSSPRQANTAPKLVKTCNHIPDAPCLLVHFTANVKSSTKTFPISSWTLNIEWHRFVARIELNTWTFSYFPHNSFCNTRGIQINMKFLCLHGMGTSAKIFEAQLSQVIGRLVGQHEFVYIDGEIECGPIAGNVQSSIFIRHTQRKA